MNANREKKETKRSKDLRHRKRNNTINVSISQILYYTYTERMLIHES